MIKNLNTETLQRIKANLALHNVFHGWEDFADDNMDRLYSDVDFELAVRKVPDQPEEDFISSLGME